MNESYTHLATHAIDFSLTLRCILWLLTTTHKTPPPTIPTLDLHHTIFVEMKYTTLGNEICTFNYKHFTPYDMLFSDLSAEL